MSSSRRATPPSGRTRSTGWASAPDPPPAGGVPPTSSPATAPSATSQCSAPTGPRSWPWWAARRARVHTLGSSPDPSSVPLECPIPPAPLSAPFRGAGSPHMGRDLRSPAGAPNGPCPRKVAPLLGESDRDGESLKIGLQATQLCAYAFGTE
jgi:hypothetical protein